MAVKSASVKTCAVLVLVAAFVPWSETHAAPRLNEGEITCTGAALTKIKPGLKTEGAPTAFEFSGEPTFLVCDDKRTTPELRIVGAELKSAGKGTGTCQKFTATFESQLEWIVAKGAEPPASKPKTTVKVTINVDLAAPEGQSKVSGKSEITEGLFKEGGKVTSGKPDVAVDVLLADCASENGLTEIVGGVAVTISSATR